MSLDLRLWTVQINWYGAGERLHPMFKSSVAFISAIKVKIISLAFKSKTIGKTWDLDTNLCVGIYLGNLEALFLV